MCAITDSQTKRDTFVYDVSEQNKVQSSLLSQGSYVIITIENITSFYAQIIKDSIFAYLNSQWDFWKFFIWKNHSKNYRTEKGGTKDEWTRRVISMIKQDNVNQTSHLKRLARGLYYEILKETKVEL